MDVNELIDILREIEEKFGGNTNVLIEAPNHLFEIEDLLTQAWKKMKKRLLLLPVLIFRNAKISKETDHEQSRNY